MDKIRFGGMASGLDTDTMVKQMMQPYRMKVDKVKQDKQTLQWKQDIYRDIIKDIRDLKSSFFDNAKPENNLLSIKNYSAYNVTNKDSQVATLSASTTGVLEGNYTVDVKSLAEPGKIVGGVISNATRGTKLSDSAILGTINATDSIKITIGTGTPIEVKVDDTSITLQQFADKITTETKGAAVARFSELTGEFVIETKETGANATISVANGSGSLLSNFKITTLSDTGVNGSVEVKDPSGATKLLSKESNNFTIDGVSYSLKGVGVSTTNITPDSDKTFDKIVSFINKYNELVDKVTKRTEEKRQYSYSPLTEDQKKEMKEDEIKKWEEKAQEGLIKGDSSLKAMLSEMRLAFTDAVEGAGISLKEIGFSTSKDTTQRGKIFLNDNLTPEDAKKKFSEVMKTKGSEVVNLFTKDGVDTKNKGIVRRLDSIVEKYTSPFGEKGVLLKKAGLKGNSTENNNILTDQIKEKDKVILNLEKSLAAKENAYYLKFAQLEKAMNNMNSQSAWLAQQLGGGKM
ncbi:flagellar hook-associated protein 2 [Clostridium punense]|uniref:Flagellar hook-associated protein 2 n=1 Tax=Clostridium punense TaxID=1054297 RepID=A0ABS4K596_9CLOT|nr:MULTISPECIES: flagellar filament capping protein FliD [Clostridium]EQB88547.1 hypothetical protein M918_03895 [Clostridium sp. BL8]MBP2021829.1 flagellar hook-associated protein 2 [Clostridium punense]